MFYWVLGQRKVCVWGSEAAPQEAQKSVTFLSSWIVSKASLYLLLCNLTFKCCSGHKVRNIFYLMLTVGIQPHRFAAQPGHILFLEKLWAVLYVGNGEGDTVSGKPI